MTNTSVEIKEKKKEKERKNTKNESYTEIIIMDTKLWTL